tara:strand:+ start:2487 stop:2927 length:441 start_codon:yes stop_codon:yes gene_type:complete
MNNLINVNDVYHETFLHDYMKENPDVEVGVHPECPKHLVLSNGRIYSRMCDRLLKGCYCATNHGYNKVFIQYGQVKRNCRVHRLVAETFLPNDNNLPQVDHIDRNRINNDISNLRWVTASENMLNRDFSNFKGRVGRKKIRNIPEV